jgi:hypothetical protein
MKTLFADGNVLCQRIHSNLRVSLIIFKNLQLKCILHYIIRKVRNIKRLVLMEEETGAPVENHPPVASH